jgi:hypothetical protein
MPRPRKFTIEQCRKIHATAVAKAALDGGFPVHKDRLLVGVASRDDAGPKISTVSLVMVPSNVGDHRPAAPRAYELYLRANQLSDDRRRWTLAKNLYANARRALWIRSPRHTDSRAGAAALAGFRIATVQ